jgi:peptide/nickel transport system permease protein
MVKKTKNYNLIIGAAITAIMLLFMLVGLFYTPYAPSAMNASAKFASASWAHPLGTDNFGRDTLSRVMEGSRTTLFVALCTVAAGTFFGVLLGAFTGYFGGLLDEVLMRVNDAVFAFPSILLALVFVSIFGSGRNNIILALGIAFIPSFARIVRGEYLKYKQMDFVTAARLAGASDLRIIFVHILPNTFAVLLPSVMIGFNNAVLAEAGMSFLGVGVQPPDPSLGRMLSESQTYLFRAPAMAVAPGLVLILLILGLSLLSDGIQEKGNK